MRSRPGFVVPHLSAVWSPLDIAGLVAWYDASDAATITESSGAVSQWDDKSGNDNHATQGTGANQPTTGTRTLNSLNVIDFDGSADVMSTASGPTFTHLFVVANNDGPTAMNSGGYPGLFTNSVEAGTNSGIALTGAVGTTFISNGASSVYRKNGTEYAHTNMQGPYNGAWGLMSLSLSGGWSSWSGYRIGQDRPYGGRFWDGAVAEIIVYDSVVLSSTDRDAVEGYLNAKWAVY